MGGQPAPPIGIDQRRHWALRVGVSLMALMLLMLSPAWDPLQRLEYDLLGGLTAPVRPDAGVVVVGIDEPSLAQLGVAPPVPRRLHADLIDSLTRAGAAALGVDLLFSAPQAASDDAALAAALQGPLPVVLASAEVEVRSSQVARYRQTVESIFTDARHGSVAMPVDDDGVLRRAPVADRAFWQALAQAAGRPVTPPPPGALMRFYAPEVPLPYVHFHQALHATRDLPPAALQGRLVLLGQHTPVGGQDQFSTPLRALGMPTQSGVFMHATALINGLTDDWIVPAPAVGPLAQAVLVIALAAALTRRWRAGRVAAVTLALALLALMGGLVALLMGVWWSSLPTLAGLALHANVGAAGSYLRERQWRERLRRDFSRYVPPSVVDALVAANTAPAVHGERRVLTLLFSDLAGFTAASERLPPEDVARALNAYFTRMTQAVHRHGGTLDKFIGDAVMAFWNAPLPDSAHAAQALACAADMQLAMEELRAQWRGTPFAAVRLRIGIHTGEAAVGHLGSQERFTYTAVGDAVNTAARLEGANKAFGTDILVSAATRAALPPGAPAAPLLWLDAVVLAGRTAAIDVYTPCEDGPLVAISLDLQGQLQAGRWTDALHSCDAWQARAAQHAPRWQHHADRFRAQVQPLAAPQPGAAQPAEAGFRPRALDKHG